MRRKKGVENIVAPLILIIVAVVVGVALSMHVGFLEQRTKSSNPSASPFLVENAVQEDFFLVITVRNPSSQEIVLRNPMLYIYKLKTNELLDALPSLHKTVRIPPKSVVTLYFDATKFFHDGHSSGTYVLKLGVKGVVGENYIRASIDVNKLPLGSSLAACTLYNGTNLILEDSDNDGKVDRTYTSLTEAINSAADGATLYILPGEYNMGDASTSKKLVLRGTECRGKTPLVNGTITFQNIAHDPTLSKDHSIGVMDLRLTNNATSLSTPLISITIADEDYNGEIILENNNITFAGQENTLIKIVGTGEASFKTRVEGNRIDLRNSPGTGYAIILENTNDTKIENNILQAATTADNITGYALKLSNANNTIISGNTLSDVIFGIGFSNSVGAQITSNHITASDFGIGVVDVENVSVISNEVSMTNGPGMVPRSGILYSGVNNGVIVSNKASDFSDGGILLLNSVGIDVNGNQLIKNNMYILSSYNVTVRGNTINNTEGWGMVIKADSANIYNVTIENNIFYNNTGGALWAYNQSNYNITGMNILYNHFIDNGDLQLKITLTNATSVESIHLNHNTFNYTSWSSGQYYLVVMDPNGLTNTTNMFDATNNNWQVPSGHTLDELILDHSDDPNYAYIDASPDYQTT